MRFDDLSAAARTWAALGAATVSAVAALLGVLARALARRPASRPATNERISLQTLIDLVPDYLWVKDLDSRFIVCNQALATDARRGSTREMIGLSDFDFHAPDAARGFREAEQAIMLSGEPMIDSEEQVIDARGARKWLSSTKIPLRNEANQVCGLVGSSRDITVRKLAESLRDGQARILEMIAVSAPLETVLDHLIRLIESQLTGIFGSVLLLDADGLHLRHGAAPSLAPAYAKAIDGVKIGPSVGSCGTAIHRRERVVVTDIQTDPLWAEFRELAGAYGYRSCWSAPILSHQAEPLGAFAMYSTSVREPTAEETRLVDLATRISGIAIERQRAEQRIHFMANHDALTGLPNRVLLNDRLTQAIRYAQRYDCWTAVIFIDLDHFKLINDSLGHGAGDELLKLVASRMTGCLRSIDSVVRFGGDEFVIVLSDQPKNVEAITAEVRRIEAAIAQPVRLADRDLRITTSIGVAVYPVDGIEAAALLGNADAAMYRAKEVGRDNFQFYTPKLNAKSQERLDLQEDLRSGLARSEFVLLYQPQVDLRTGAVLAVEALIRWNHPVLGLVSPARFIPVAEETGLIVSIGDWVLREACRQNRAWQDAGLKPISVGVNVSARQFSEKGLIDRVVRALEDSRLDPSYLELELTESLIMQDVEQAIATMGELRKLGVRLSIDDFGTGYSSLSALKSFPVARLKIDRSFIADLSRNASDRAVTSAVISLGQKLNLRVIAEGVETDDQVAFLRANNCDEIQGYHFSKPLAAPDVPPFLVVTRDRPLPSVVPSHDQ